MNKAILTIMTILLSNFCFCQINSNELLEPVAFTKACLEAAKIPNSDTLECYPEGTKKWLVLIEQYVNILSEKLNPEAKKGLIAANQEWLKIIEKELQETNQIIQDKNLPLITRKQAAIRQFKFAEKRALNLKKVIEEYK